MTLYDIAIIGIVLICTLTALMRGVVAELASLIAWVVAFLGAKYFSPIVAPIALASVEPESLRLIVTFILLFFLLLAGQYFLRSFLTQIIKAIGLNGVNKFLGAIFGLAKGFIIATIMVVICSLTSLPQTPEWKESVMIPVVDGFARIGMPYLPENVANVIPYQ